MKRLVILIFLLSPSIWGNFQKELTLVSEGIVAKQEICLQDLIEDGWVKTRCELEGEKCCLWNLDGVLSKTFTRSDLQQRINQQISFGFDLILKGADSLLVSQKYRLATISELTVKLNEKIKAVPQTKDYEGEWVLDEVKTQRPFYVGLNELSSWNIEFVMPLKSRMSFRLYSGSGETKQLLGAGDFNLKLMKNAYFSGKNIKSGEKISSNDFYLKKTDILPFISGVRKPLFILKDAPQVLKSSVSADTAIYQDNLQIEPQVKIGDVVNLVLKSDGLKFTTKATSQTNAIVGDNIKVQLLKGNRTFQGKLLEDKLVEVSL